MDIDIKWLRDFLALSKTLSFSRAAKERHVTQPAFSRRIQSLEEKLGCKLFNRLKQPVELTEQGIAFQQTTIKVLTELDSGIRLLTTNASDAINVNFAATHTLSLGVFPALAKYMNDLPFNVETQLNVADADDCVELLTKRHCDFLLAFSDPLLDNFQEKSILLGVVPMLPVCQANEKGEPLFKLESDEKNIPYLAYQHNIYLGRVVDQLIKSNQQKLKVKRTLQSPMADSLKMMAVKGLGVAWIPAFSMEQELKTGQLVICGGSEWQPALEVRLYRNKSINGQLEPVWESLRNIVI